MRLNRKVGRMRNFAHSSFNWKSFVCRTQDPRLRQIVTMGSQDTLEEKTVTVCVASDFVNINFINFCCTRKEIAKLWTDSLMSLAYNLNRINGTNSMFLLKAYTKISLIPNKTGKIPVKKYVSIIRKTKNIKMNIVLQYCENVCSK